MKTSLIILSILLLFSCQSITTNNANSDSTLTPTQNAHFDSLKADIPNKVNNMIYGDTTGVWKAPIIIYSKKVVKSESGSLENIQLKYKNTSSKNITAIKFRWKGVDAFGDPADMGTSRIAEGYGAGYTDVELKLGKSTK